MVPLAPQDVPVQRESPAHQALMGPKETEALPEQTAGTVRMVHLAGLELKASVECLEEVESLELTGPRVTLVPQDAMVARGRLAEMARPVPQARRETRVLRADQEHQDLTELKETSAPLGVTVALVLLAEMEGQVGLERKVTPAHPVVTAVRAGAVARASKETAVWTAGTALRAVMESRVTVVWTALQAELVRQADRG